MCGCVLCGCSCVSGWVGVLWVGVTVCVCVTVCGCMCGCVWVCMRVHNCVYIRVCVVDCDHFGRVGLVLHLVSLKCSSAMYFHGRKVHVLPYRYIYIYSIWSGQK